MAQKLAEYLQLELSMVIISKFTLFLSKTSKIYIFL